MKFFGPVGYGQSVEGAPGVWSDSITERPYYGDVVRNSRRLSSGDSLNDDLSVSNSISIVADAYALDNFFAIRYVKWNDVYWKVREVEIQHPRLILRIGEVYNGPKA